MVRILLFACSCLPVLFAVRPLPPHVTLVRPLGEAPKLFRPPSPSKVAKVERTACGHIVTIPADPAIDPGIISRDPTSTPTQMPIFNGYPPCSSGASQQNLLPPQ